jgi:hypothetical protein
MPHRHAEYAERERDSELAPKLLDTAEVMSRRIGEALGTSGSV